MRNRCALVAFVDDLPARRARYPVSITSGRVPLHRLPPQANAHQRQRVSAESNAFSIEELHNDMVV